MHPASSNGQPTKDSLTEAPLAEADDAKAFAQARTEIWVKKNAQAFECWNSHIEKNGLPLEKYRSF